MDSWGGMEALCYPSCCALQFCEDDAVDWTLSASCVPSESLSGYVGHVPVSKVTSGEATVRISLSTNPAAMLLHCIPSHQPPAPIPRPHGLQNDPKKLGG